MAVAYQGVAYQAEDEAADVRAGAIAAIVNVTRPQTRTSRFPAESVISPKPHRRFPWSRR